EALLWWIRSQPVPPVATASLAGRPAAGALTDPGTGLVLGGGGINGDAVPGGRFTAGAWFDNSHTAGFQAGYLILGTQETTRGVATGGAPQLFRPFLDANAARPTAAPVAAPGGVAVVASADGLQGASAVFRENVFSTG